jgi:hypothetical protein
MRNKTEVQVTKRQILKVCLQRWLPITNLWKLLWSVVSTVISLPGVAVLYVAVFAPGGAPAPAPHLRCSSSVPTEHRTLRPVALARRASPRLLAYAVPVLMFFPLAWELVVDSRFATSCWEGYHFWIPVVQYIWYIQYAIFPF